MTIIDKALMAADLRRRYAHGHIHMVLPVSVMIVSRVRMGNGSMARKANRRSVKKGKRRYWLEARFFESSFIGYSLRPENEFGISYRG